MACGWSVAPTVAGLAEALSLATALPPANLEAMGRRGRDWVRADYAWSEVARRHLVELYGGPDLSRRASPRA